MPVAGFVPEDAPEWRRCSIGTQERFNLPIVALLSFERVSRNISVVSSS
jgi:hypothetical protein